MHYKLTPLLSNVRRNKINSFFQIRDRLDEKKETEDKMIFNPEMKKKIDPLYKTIDFKLSSKKKEVSP